MHNVRIMKNFRNSSLLSQQYPDAGTSLVFRTPFELLVAAIYQPSAQISRLNRITPACLKNITSPRTSPA
jgi:endonuclease III